MSFVARNPRAARRVTWAIVALSVPIGLYLGFFVHGWQAVVLTLLVGQVLGWGAVWASKWFARVPEEKPVRWY